MATWGQSKRDWRRYKALFGIAAIGGFLLALPGAAMACVTQNACQIGGGIPNSPPGNCGGGVENGQPICAGSNSSSPNTDYVYKHAPTGATLVSSGESSGSWNPDPYFYGWSFHDDGAAITSASGLNNGQAPSAHTTDLGGGAVAQYSGFSKSLGLTNNQALAVGFLVNYDSSRTSYNASPLAPGFLNGSTVNTSTYTFDGQLVYYAGSAYFGGTVGGEIGHGNQTSATGGSGGYGIRRFRVFGRRG